MRPLIEISDLTKSYGSLQAVRGVSFAVAKGEIFGMLGPNGAGKTTTVEIIEGLRERDGGRVRVFGLDPSKAGPEIKSRTGVQLQQVALYPRLRVGEVIRLFASFYERQADPDELISLLGLEERRNARVAELSGGQAQRLSVVLTTHYMEEAERLCDRVAVMDHGKIIALDTPRSLVHEHFEQDAIEFSSTMDWSISELRGLDSVSSATAQGSEYNLFSTNVPDTMGDLLRLSDSKGLRIEGMRVRHATLEDVFLKLTGRTLRD